MINTHVAMRVIFNTFLKLGKNHVCMFANARHVEFEITTELLMTVHDVQKSIERTVQQKQTCQKYLHNMIIYCLQVIRTIPNTFI